VFAFNKAIIDATHDIACCYKPQIAHYAAQAAETELQMTIDYIKQKSVPVLLDAKRGDVGSTATMYAIELFERYGADAVTINPYLGQDAMQPYLDYADKGIFILCRTSNPGSAELQNLVLESGRTLYQHVAEIAVSQWNSNGNVGLVVGATQPDELKQIRSIVGETTLLLPGVGSQGADVGSMMDAGQGGGMLVSASRSIIFAAGDDFAQAARDAAITTRDEINQYRS
jgi:orotidine-5'-phosphate decarboxylase